MLGVLGLKQGSKFANSLDSIFRVGAVVLVICVLVSLFHVLDMRNIYRKQAMESLEDIYLSCLELVNGEVSQIKEQIDRYKSEVEENLSDKQKVVDVLNEMSVPTEGYMAFYVENSPYVYGPNGMFYNKDYYTVLSRFPINRFDNDYCCVYGSETPFFNNDKSLVGIYKIHLTDTDNAYLVLYKPTEYVINKESFSYINSIGTMFLADLNGNVIDVSNPDQTEFVPGDNCYTNIANVSNGYLSTTNKIDDVRNHMSSTTENSFSVKSKSGYEIFATYHKVNGIRGLYLFEVYNEKIFDDKIAPGVTRSVIACLLLTGTLMFVIIVVFVYMQNSRNTVEKLAYIDDISGGYNYNYFKQRAVELVKDNSEIHFIMCRFDIVNFRYINEAYGHDKADKVLKATYEQFKKVFTNKELCVRVNSDQFVALIINDIETSHRYQKYNRLVEEQAKEIGVRFPIRFKTGFYQIHKEDRNIDVMIDHANAARKSVDINKKVIEAIYSEDIISNMKKVDAIESQMNASLNKGEFKVYLQPKWDIINDKVMGAEALVRWVKDDGTIVSPGDFIPIFETNGFIEKLDFYMLEKICAILGELEKDENKKAYPISVNQSRILINNPDYIKNVERVLNRYEIDHNNIQLEITETVFFDEKEKMIEVVNRLKEFGLTLDMDDFGSGYSSLNILKDIAFDVLKIDKEFFSESAASKTSIVILQKIIEMADALNISVICEGVETAEQVELLKSVGCKAVQGYFYGRPMPMEEFIEKYCVINHESKD